MATKSTALVQGLCGSDRGRLFDEAYYTERFGPNPYNRNEGWLQFFGGVADEIVRSLRPARVFDAGCAMGMLVESLWDRGVEAWGADISPYAIGSVRRDMQPYCRLASITEPFGGHFDLVTCIEVLEHMPEEEACLAIEQMCRASDAVLFSSTPDDLNEPTHINVHPVIYWLKLFGESSFAPDLTYDAGFICPHAILFRRVPRPVGNDVLSSFAQLLRLKAAVVNRDQRLAEAHKHISSLEASLAAGTEARQTAEQQIEELKEQTTEAAALHEAEAAHLTQTLSGVKGELLAIQQSLGWRFILRYRKWLSAARTRQKWVDRWFEPLASRFVRRLAGRRPVTQDATPEPANTPYEDWIRLNEPTPADLEVQRRTSSQLKNRPKISIILPVYKVSQSVLADTIDSVVKQTYDNWELCLVHGDPDAAETRTWLSSLAVSDTRVKLQLLDSNLGISDNSNQALAQSTGEFVALLDHDDTLAPSALFEVAVRLNKDPQLDFLFSDKDQLSADGRHRIEPLFKPAWSPDLMLSANYLTHFCVIRTEAVRRIGGWRSETDGAQDWDLFLRAIEDPKRVAHIPKVLYHWRRVSTSCAATGFEAKPYAAAAQLAVVQADLDRRQWSAKAAFSSSGMIQLRWNISRRPGTTVILVSNAASAPAYPGAEVLLVNDEEGSLASRLDEAVRQSSGDYLVFLDQFTRPDANSWLDEIVAPLSQPGIAVVGSKLLDPETCHIRHAGICFNPGGQIAYPFASENEYIHNVFGGPNWYRNWLAVSGACIGIRRDAFEAVGGFSTQPEFPRLDVDLCLKVLASNCGRVFYNPFTRLWQTKPAALERWLTADGPAYSAKYIASKFPAGDPFFNPNLVVQDGRITLHMTRAVAAPRPARPAYEGQLARRPGNSSEDGKVYIIRNGRKHWIMDHRWALENGFRWPDDVKTIPASELNAIPSGEPLNYLPGQ